MILLSTFATPGAHHAALSASWHSAHDRTVPLFRNGLGWQDRILRSSILRNRSARPLALELFLLRHVRDRACGHELWGFPHEAARVHRTLGWRGGGAAA